MPRSRTQPVTAALFPRLVVSALGLAATVVAAVFASVVGGPIGGQAVAGVVASEGVGSGYGLLLGAEEAERTQPQTTVAARAPLCFGRRPTIVGTADGEVLAGTPGADVIVGMGGRDRIVGRGGNDRICDDVAEWPGDRNQLKGGPGDDRIRGGDRLLGEKGDDVLVARPGPGLVDGQTFHLRGGRDADVLRGGPNRDSFWGSNLAGGPGPDKMIGTRNDFIIFPASNPMVVNLSTGTAQGHGLDTLVGIHTVFTGAADDILRGSPQSDQLNASGGDDVIVGRGGDDSMSGTFGNDFLSGNAGDDSLHSGVGRDTLDGGLGNDHCVAFDPGQSTYIDCERFQ